jgi:hypothetical protein
MVWERLRLTFVRGSTSPASISGVDRVPGMRGRCRVGLSVVSGIVAGVVLAACSSGSSSPTTTVTPGVGVLGAPYSVWVRSHPPVTVDGVSGYGATVTVAGRSTPEFTNVRQLDGRVVSLHLSLAQLTRLAAAEAQVRAQLPSDARQTASWRGSFSGSQAGHCEFVNYQSQTLAHSLGTSAPTSAIANIGTSLYERTSGAPGAASIARVNSADISTAANVVGATC